MLLVYNLANLESFVAKKNCIILYLQLSMSVVLLVSILHAGLCIGFKVIVS